MKNSKDSKDSHNIEIFKAEKFDLEAWGLMFDHYRQFYGMPSELSNVKEFLSQRLEANDSVIYLAKYENEWAGFVQLYPLWSSVHLNRLWILNDLFVEEKHRRKGVAQALMQEAMKIGELDKTKGLFLQTDRTNKTAQIVYEELGWKKDETTFYYEYYPKLNL